MAPAPVTTPTSNGDSDQVQAFEKVASPISEEPPLVSTEEPAASNGQEEAWKKKIKKCCPPLLFQSYKIQLAGSILMKEKEFCFFPQLTFSFLLPSYYAYN